MKLVNFVAPLITVVCSVMVNAVRIPNADTPLFYLVAASSSQSFNLLVRSLFPSTGCLVRSLIGSQSLRFPSGSGTWASLLGSGSFPKWYFWQGNLVVVAPDGGSTPWRPFINTIPAANGCSKSGPLGFTLGSTNKCAKYGNFQIQSFGENSQLGAKLVVDYTGGFYACGSNSFDVGFSLCPGRNP